MGVDHTNGAGIGVEAVEDQQRADRPPPPPDGPGAQPDCVPSRADSRAAAAEANKPDTSQPVEESRQDDSPAAAENESESRTEPESPESNEPTSESVQGPFGELDERQEPTSAENASTSERPLARDDQSGPQDGAATSGGLRQRHRTAAQHAVALSGRRCAHWR